MKQSSSFRDCERLLVRARRACHLLDCGTTRLYELLKSGELESFLDGRARKISVESIQRYIAKKLAATQAASALPKLSATKSAAETSPTLSGTPRQGTDVEPAASQGRSARKRTGDSKVSP